QPVSSSAATSSAASQQRHLPVIGYLEDLHPVTPLAQGFLGNHDGIALHALTTKVEASPNRLDPAIHRNGDVTFGGGSRRSDPASDLGRHHAARAAHVG